MRLPNLHFPMNPDYSRPPQPESPLYQQIAAEIKQWIESGRLKKGDAVPSTRHMANLLGVARRTVMRGYEVLISQGYLKSISGIGTVVSHDARENSPPFAENHIVIPTRDSDLHTVLSDYGKRLLRFEPDSGMPADSAGSNFGGPPPELLPIKEWRQILLRHLNYGPEFKPADVLDPFGYLPLRRVLADYLRRTRGVHCAAEQVAVFSAAQLQLSPGE